MYIFTKFHKDWTKIVDFLLIAKFLASPDNYASPSSSVVVVKSSSALQKIKKVAQKAPKTIMTTVIEYTAYNLLM